MNEQQIKNVEIELDYQIATTLYERIVSLMDTEERKLPNQWKKRPISWMLHNTQVRGSWSKKWIGEITKRLINQPRMRGAASINICTWYQSNT